MVKNNNFKKKFCIFLIVLFILIFVSILFVSSASGNEKNDRLNKKIDSRVDKKVYEMFEEKNKVTVMIKLKKDELNIIQEVSNPSGL